MCGRKLDPPICFLINLWLCLLSHNLLIIVLTSLDTLHSCLKHTDMPYKASLSFWDLCPTVPWYCDQAFDRHVSKRQGWCPNVIPSAYLQSRPAVAVLINKKWWKMASFIFQWSFPSNNTCWVLSFFFHFLFFTWQSIEDEGIFCILKAKAFRVINPGNLSSLSLHFTDKGTEMPGRLVRDQWRTKTKPARKQKLWAPFLPATSTLLPFSRMCSSVL